MNVLTQPATFEDFHSIVSMFQTYAAEIGPRPIDVAGAYAHVETYAEHPECLILIAYYGGKPAGMLLASRTKRVFHEYDGHIEIQYVLPEFRGTGVSRALVKSALSWMKRHKVYEVATADDSGLGPVNARLFENLYKKFGFTYSGGRNLILTLGGAA